MILYSVALNNGGMRRVVESMIDFERTLPRSYPLKIIIFSPKRPKEAKSNRFFWIPWDESDAPYTPKNVEKIRRRVDAIFEKSEPEWIVGDAMTLGYFQNLKSRICYDTHILTRRFYQAFNQEKGMDAWNAIYPDPVVQYYHAFELSSLRSEARFMARAECFIANSKTTTKDLKTIYADVVGKKKVFHVPVSTVVTPLAKPTGKADPTTADFLYTYSRLHLIKGWHQILGRNWRPLKIVLRGINPELLTKKLAASLLKNGIEARPWESDSEKLAQELIQSRAVLFPSIYEPWGLALQEALALGKICIAHRNRSGHEEQIQNQVNGFLLDFSAADLKEKIQKILAMPEKKLKQISEKAKHRSRMGHDARNKKLRQVFDRLRKL
ncbi:MAG: glycosyltransferase [Bdellovibrionales bacterium]|nr:glycosyltransferase [Bdellovibrionales bacterium]